MQGHMEKQPDIDALIEQGITAPALAGILGKSVRTAYRYIQHSNAAHDRRERFKAQVARLLSDGKQPPEIAELLGVDKSWINKSMKRWGFKKRKPVKQKHPSPPAGERAFQLRAPEDMAVLSRAIEWHTGQLLREGFSVDRSDLTEVALKSYAYAVNKYDPSKASFPTFFGLCMADRVKNLRRKLRTKYYREVELNENLLQ